MSGVSEGTVDRVLHNRGRVSEESMRKVKKVLDKINYKPNLIARSLASQKKCRILALIPSFVPGEYWAEVSDGIDKAKQEYSDFHVKADFQLFNQYDNMSFDRAIKEMESKEYQGVIIATLFKDSAFKLAKRLDKKKIPYVLIDAYIENTNCIAYYGADSYRSGHIGGRLLFERIKPDDNIFLFNIISKNSIDSTQVSIREKGFRDYLSKMNFKGQIYPINLSADYPEYNEKVLNFHVKKNIMNGAKARAGIIFNSRVHVPAEYFNKHQIKDFCLIGYDAIDLNIHYLHHGTVSYLIAQRPEVQGYNSVKALFQHLILDKTVQKMNYMPIDILLEENIEYYNNYI